MAYCASDYKRLFDSMTTAVVVADASLTLVYANSAAEWLLDISLQRSANTCLTSYFQESANAFKKMQQAISHKQQFTKRKALWELHTGKRITVDYTLTPVTEQNEIILEIQPLDRLLRISREESLLASQATTKHLIRGLAHEVKNPLGGIRGAAQLLERELNTDELKEYTQIIMAESDRLRNLVDRMLGPRHPVVIKPVNIHEVLERVITIVQAEDKGKLTFLRHYDPSIPELPGDMELLIQAILNIVRNAMQALSAQTDNQQPTITITTRVNYQLTIGRKRHALVAQITIADNGPGIDPQLLDTIFYPMISGRADGTGLGLSISQQLITQHHGLIECTSEPGNTLFSLSLPFNHEAEEYYD